MHCSLLYPILHYPTTQYFKLILGNNFPLFFPSYIPAISGQVPKLLTTETQLLLSSFKLFPQSGKELFLFEHAAQDRVILF